MGSRGECSPALPPYLEAEINDGERRATLEIRTDVAPLVTHVSHVLEHRVTFLSSSIYHKCSSTSSYADGIR